MSQNNAFNAWGAPAQAPSAAAPAQQTPQPGFAPPAAPATAQTAPFGAPASPSPGVPAGFGAPAPGQAAPATSQAFGFNPMAGFKPELGRRGTDFPNENGFHLIQVSALRQHNGRKGFFQIFEGRVIASTSASLVPGQTPSGTIRLTGDFANREITDLLSALAGYDKTRDKDRVLAEINLQVLFLANFTEGVQPDVQNPLANQQGPGVFAGKYLLVETYRQAKKDDPTRMFTNFRFYAVPQPPDGQSYNDEHIRAILARQYNLPEPPPVGQ